MLIIDFGNFRKYRLTKYFVCIRIISDRKEEKIVLENYEDRMDFIRGELNLDDKSVRKMFARNEQLHDCKARRVRH